MRKTILKELNILYAEDEDDVRMFTNKTLNSMVSSITSVENGKEGIEVFLSNPDKFNLIITDINMPKMNGLDMCKEIRKINSDIPIVITSAHNDENFLKTSIEIGVSSYTMKPIDLYQLMDSIVKAVEPHYLRKELENSKLQTQNDISYLKKILDSQENIIMVSSTTEIETVNKKFLDFFKIKSCEEFKDKYNSIDSLFHKEQGLFGFFGDKSSNWIEEIKNLNEINRIVKLKDENGSLKTFIVNVDTYELDKNKYVISFTDITEIRKKSALLEYQANHDPLTGLLNRAAFNKIYNSELKRDIRYNHSLSLILFDIDDFKHINDNFGHNIGDEVLKFVAKTTQNNIREYDTVTRWGGEEFIILLPETNIDGALQVAEKTRNALDREKVKNLPHITASFGVVELQYEDTNESFIKRADDALYQAKRDGKNKVVSL